MLHRHLNLYYFVLQNYNVKHDLWLDYVDPEYHMMDAEEKSLYDQGLKEFAKYTRQLRVTKTNTGVQVGSTSKKKGKRANTRRVSEVLRLLSGVALAIPFMFFYSVFVLIVFYMVVFKIWTIEIPQSLSFLSLLSPVLFIAAAVGSPFLGLGLAMGYLKVLELVFTKVSKVNASRLARVEGVVTALFLTSLLVGYLASPPLHELIGHLVSTAVSIV
ncbi:hypothetical protein IC007_0629 [Sulfuracidifex tepidarius]|uniref:Uncharacterized protein n=1 Tax=Sulfuracidifex tepidarius TaxID=1294262 RepID=A0A510E0V7_9CREN|nr:hypothetical protein IC007_0629 [Sulfuracidifex tepidarius]